jgi:hypothetical protein
MTAPYRAGYAGLIRVNSPHPQSYRPEIPLGTPPVSWHNTAEEVRAYCRVHGITFTGPALCKPIKMPSGTVHASPTIHLAGQQDWTQ